MNDIVSDVKKYKAGWTSGLPETSCGSGSKITNTKIQRDWIPSILENYKIKSISDIGAGDLNWIKEVDLSAYEYKAYDLVPRHKGIHQFDLLTDQVPKSDIIICLWVLNHFPKENALIAFNNIINSGSSYLMITTRPKWKNDQPDEMDVQYIDRLVLNNKKEAILLIDLNNVNRI